ncbi:MAG TPA: ABC transporter ATP-binding protein [Vicinamibacterales bacterium]
MIRARDLRKVYRLYTGPGYRFLDMFGMLGDRPGTYTEHAALDGVSLDIKRGEKVAFIGRNGAGKSTLLKLVTSVIEPTSGTLEVTGKAHALLQIGTGFHPDFTGRENVFAYLAQLGVTGAEAERRYRDIVEFAELEEYIGQPVKTYSSGMAVRLMFSTATAITPELLVLDEVLGVGDAYFAQKSYERMRELTEGAGTTLLLVTHDIYSASKICERIIWIDRGRVLMDDESHLVIKAYEDSIRQQEEARLRLKKQARLKELAAESGSESVVLEIKPTDGRPAPSPVYFSRIALLREGQVVSELPLGEDAFDEGRPAHLIQEGTSWGPATTWQGRHSRSLQNFGSAFHRAAGVVSTDRAPDAATTVVIEYWSDSECDLAVRAFLGNQSYVLGQLSGQSGAWHSAALPMAGGAETAVPHVGVNTSGMHGSGALIIKGTRILGPDGQETHSLRHREPATLELDYELRDPAFRERPQIVIALHRDGVQDVCRWISRDLLLDRQQRREGHIHLRIPALLLTDGQYSVTILVAKEGYYDTQQTRFFTLNPDVYYCGSRMFDIVVRGSGLIGSGTVSVAEGEWSVVD